MVTTLIQAVSSTLYSSRLCYVKFVRFASFLSHQVGIILFCRNLFNLSRAVVSSQFSSKYDDRKRRLTHSHLKWPRKPPTPIDD